MTQDQISMAWGDARTRLPDGLSFPPEWLDDEPSDPTPPEPEPSDEHEIPAEKEPLQAGEPSSSASGRSVENIRQSIADHGEDLQRDASFLIDDLERWITRLDGEKPNAPDRLYVHNQRVVLLRRSITMLHSFSEILENANKEGERAPVNGGSVPKAAEDTANLFQEYVDEFHDWMRNNKKNVVDAVFKGTGMTVAIGSAVLFFSTVGLPTVAATALGTLIFGGRKTFKLVTSVRGGHQSADQNSDDS